MSINIQKSAEGLAGCLKIVGPGFALIREWARQQKGITEKQFGEVWKLAISSIGPKVAVTCRVWKSRLRKELGFKTRSCKRSPEQQEKQIKSEAARFIAACKAAGWSRAKVLTLVEKVYG